MRIEVISPHGFCGGVDRAIRIAKQTIEDSPPPVYCLHEIVHNQSVVQELSAKGMRFVDAVEDVPDGSVMIVSAHGASPHVFDVATSSGIYVVDATCPFVAAVHRRIRDNFSNGMRTVVIGEPKHAEVCGYLGEPGACLPEDVKVGERYDTVVQTTLDSSAHKGVCTATRDRQRAVREFVGRFRDSSSVGVLVVGGMNSSNSRRLVETAEGAGAAAWLVDSAHGVATLSFSGVDVLGVTSGASTPEYVLESVVSSLPNGSSVQEDFH